MTSLRADVTLKESNRTRHTVFEKNLSLGLSLRCFVFSHSLAPPTKDILKTGPVLFTLDSQLGERPLVGPFCRVA